MAASDPHVIVLSEDDSTIETDETVERKRKSKFIIDEASDRSTKKPSTKAAGHIRQHILITLSHAESVDISLPDLMRRIPGAFVIEKMVGCTEKHAEGGHHYHIAVHAPSASKHTATKIIRSLYPEFDGRGINVKFHKCWLTMLQYVTKEDPNWMNNIYGDYCADDARDELKSRVNKTMNAVHVVRKHISDGKSIESLVHNDDVAPFLFRSSAPLRFAEMCVATESVRSTVDSILALAHDIDLHDARAHCSADQLLALEHFGKQLVGRRPRQRQVYCVGPSGTGKSFPFLLLAGCTRCFTPCLENGDRAFAGWDDSRYDWIYINDFDDNIKFQLLSNLLEGAEMKLNGYGRQHSKLRNVPVVITANDKPRYPKLSPLRLQALENRLQIIRFSRTMTSEEDKDPELTREMVCSIVANFIE